MENLTIQQNVPQPRSPHPQNVDTISINDQNSAGNMKNPFLNASPDQMNNTNIRPSSQPQNFNINKNMMYLQQQQQIPPFMYNMIYQNMQNNNNSNNMMNNMQNVNSNNSHFTFHQNAIMNSTTMLNAFTNFFNLHNQRYLLSQQSYTAETLKTEYNALKRIEHDSPQTIKDNLSKFENNILLPFYIQINKSISLKKSMYTETYAKYHKLITNVLTKFKIEDTKVQAYGSIMNNFLIEDGDIDICIVPEKLTIEEFSVRLDDIKNEITSNNVGQYALSHISPRYSLLKVIDNDTGLTVDITVHTQLPLHNTKLIRLYSLYDQRFHIMGIYIKHWVKRNKLNGATEKYLSSYAYLLMIIHFLQTQVHPQVLPILQKVQNKTEDYTYSHSGVVLNTNLYFEEDMDKVNEYMKIINNSAENTDSVTELIVKFFEYYAYQYDHKYLISISSSEQKLSSSEHIAFPIEDPFDIEHNPGKSMKLNTPQYDMFLNCMKKEINMLMGGDYVNNIINNNSHHGYSSDS